MSPTGPLRAGKALVSTINLYNNTQQYHIGIWRHISISSHYGSHRECIQVQTLVYKQRNINNTRLEALTITHIFSEVIRVDIYTYKQLVQ